jgi:hypothetical protein
LLVTLLPPDTGNKSALPATQTDMSYIATGDGWTMKLVYLPDYSDQQAINVSPGLFGAASLAATLENGALMNLNASDDASKILAAVAQVATAAVGKSAAVATKAAVPAAVTATKKVGVAAPQPLLAPGLYQFVYDSTGSLTGLRLMSAFPLEK